MRGGEAIPPLFQYAFMAWCSFKKAQGQLYLTIGTPGFLIQFTSLLLLKYYLEVLLFEVFRCWSTRIAANQEEIRKKCSVFL
jgi:hypothetical protein